MLRNLFRRSRFDDSTHDLYESVVARAREPVFYSELGVPDTLDGRFEMILLHAILTMRRLRRCGDAGARRAQKLFDIMFADFDRSLRDIGVGDLKVGSRIKKMGQAFYGRSTSYDAALAAGTDEELIEALRRNVYGTSDASETTVAALAAQIRTEETHLAGLDDGALLKGGVDFGPAPLPSAGREAI